MNRLNRIASIVNRHYAKELDPAANELKGTVNALVDTITWIRDNINTLSDKDLAEQLRFLRYDLKDELLRDIDKFLKVVGLERFVLEETNLLT